ncbi:hypothetical protein ACIBQ1_56055 [Nonomuraea sp. NPDC050153]|uniref:hypothetical protein n=1 Tax=Nonomuraea sp. NPDC050153 TaxID=3364359 RepID=UPI0037ACD2B2
MKARIFAVGALLLGTVLATAAPAAADDSAAPACVSYGQSYRYLTATNNCEDGVHVYATYANGEQGVPHYVAAGTYTTIGSGYGYSNVSGLYLAAKTTVQVHYDAGFGNNVSIRGSVAPLSWASGQPCVNQAADLWECTVAGIPGGQAFEYKVLINDSTWSTGGNHAGVSGYGHDITPSF